MKNLKLFMLILAMTSGVTSFALTNSNTDEDGCFVTTNYYNSNGVYLYSYTTWNSSCTTDSESVNVVLREK